MSWWLLTAALLLLPRRPPRAARRIARSRRGPLPLNGVGALIGMLASVILMPLPWSALAAVVVGGAGWRWLPRSFSSDQDRAELALARALPDAVDLLGAVLRVGLSDGEALLLVAGAIDGPLRHHLTVVGRHRALGAAPERAWRAVADVPALAELARAMTRHAATGSPVAAVLDRVAADARRDYHSRAQMAARSAAVRAVIPLAVCFLPAFVLLGVVPIVASLVSDLSF